MFLLFNFFFLSLEILHSVPGGFPKGALWLSDLAVLQVRVDVFDQGIVGVTNREAQLTQRAAPDVTVFSLHPEVDGGPGLGMLRVLVPRGWAAECGGGRGEGFGDGEGRAGRLSSDGPSTQRAWGGGGGPFLLILGGLLGGAGSLVETQVEELLRCEGISSVAGAAGHTAAEPLPLLLIPFSVGPGFGQGGGRVELQAGRPLVRGRVADLRVAPAPLEARSQVVAGRAAGVGSWTVIRVGQGGPPMDIRGQSLRYRRSPLGGGRVPLRDWGVPLNWLALLLGQTPQYFGLFGAQAL